LILKNINLIDFRNFKNLKKNFNSKLNIFIGHNGQGKSNLLEAISLLTNGYSFRKIDNEGLIQFNNSASVVNSEVIKNNLAYSLRIKIDSKSKRFEINEKKVSQSDLNNAFFSIVFSPESLSIIKASDEERRNFLDEWVAKVHKSNSQVLNDFQRCLKTRNRILKNYIKEQTSLMETEKLLDSINPIYLKLCVDVTLKRLNAIHELYNYLNESYQRLSQQNVDISVEYVISEKKIINFDQETVHKILLDRMRQLRTAELASGISLVGPHKHDITFLYNGKDSRFFCSQGQQRALILAFKMAQIVYHNKAFGEQPILLLDDVLSELDLDKRSALLNFLKELETQTFITTTDINLPQFFSGQETTVFDFSNGELLERLSHDE
jgi:DNA replication and repair protein RecF